MDALATDFPNWVTGDCASFNAQPMTTATSFAKEAFPFVIYDGKRIKKSTVQHIQQLINAITLPSHWMHDNIAPPSTSCKKKTKHLAYDIAITFGLVPDNVLASIEEGIMLIYRQPDNNLSLKLEVYNDGDIAGIINQDKTIVLAMDIEKSSDHEKLVTQFKHG